MKSERAWAGIICGFFLFIVVCLSLLLHMKGAFRATGNPELGLLVLFATRCGGKLPLPGSAGAASAYRRYAGCAYLSGRHAVILRHSTIFLAGTGVAI